jgi:hypothetical protein
MQKNFFEIYRKIGHAISKRYFCPAIDHSVDCEILIENIRRPILYKILYVKELLPIAEEEY